MINFYCNFLTWLGVLAGILLSATNIHAVTVNGFPQQCAFATDRAPMEGHILRLGHINNTPYGWSFLFPDKQGMEVLDRVELADNVGLINQTPSVNPYDSIHTETPSGEFLVGQIFVGDPNLSPVVTCVSNVMAIESLDPTIYGPDFVWLNRALLGQLLDIRNYSITWNWQPLWGSRIQEIRNNFKGFREAHGATGKGAGRGERAKPSDREAPSSAAQAHAGTSGQQQHEMTKGRQKGGETGGMPGGYQQGAGGGQIETQQRGMTKGRQKGSEMDGMSGGYQQGAGGGQIETQQRGVTTGGQKGGQMGGTPGGYQQGAGGGQMRTQQRGMTKGGHKGGEMSGMPDGSQQGGAQMGTQPNGIGHGSNNRSVGQARSIGAQGSRGSHGRARGFKHQEAR